MEMKIDIKEVEKIAKLCDLELTEKEKEHYSKILTDTLEYIKTLEELDISEVAETHNVTGLVNIFQDKDAPDQTLTQEEALKNASEKQNGLFATQGVFENRGA